MCFVSWTSRIGAPARLGTCCSAVTVARSIPDLLRVDSSKYFLGLRLNIYVACTLTVAGLAWFAVVQRRGRRMAAAGLPAPELAAGGAGPERAITETPAARHDRVHRTGLPRAAPVRALPAARAYITAAVAAVQPIPAMLCRGRSPAARTQEDCTAR